MVIRWPGTHREGSRRGAMTARPFLVLVRHEEVEGRLATMRRGRWHLVPMEGNGERGRSSGEGRMRCGLLRGSSGRLL
jgi:hypothetical protein